MNIVFVLLGIFFLASPPIFFTYLFFITAYKLLTLKKKNSNKDLEGATEYEYKEEEHVVLTKFSHGRDATEYQVSNFLKNNLDDESYFVLNDVILPSGTNAIATSQIDHIIVSNFGIFCIETKSHSGNIYGAIHNENWTQYLYNNESYKIYNPVKQNRGHVLAINNILGSLKRNAIVPIVVFPYARSIKVFPTGSALDLEDMLSKINSYEVEIYSDQEVQSIIRRLESNNRSFFPGAHEDHIVSVQQLIAKK
jgi:hypothetical protein